MSNDARLSTGLPGHPKTKKLIRRLGPAAGWSFVCLILWARDNRPDGDLSGLTAEDIELAVDWHGENDAFVSGLVAVGFLDGADGGYRLHDWEEHQPWSAGSEARSESAKWKSLCRHHGRNGAAERMPEYAAKLASSTESDAGSKKQDAGSNGSAMLPDAGSKKTPPPSPYPYPSPNPLEAEELLSSATPKTDLLGTKPVPDDLAARRAQRLVTVTEDAIAAYNRILGRPNGLLASVSKVGRKTRRKEIQRCLETASEICDDQFRDKKITPEFWDLYFTACGEDGFTSGAGPYTGAHANWRPDFEYLTRPAVMLKVFERATQEDAA